MVNVSFENVGNLGDYRLEHQRVKSFGLLTTPSLILKLYQMTKNSYFDPWQIKITENFLEEEINKGEIKSLTGIGFAIQSKDMLNVVRWDEEYPILMKNILYGFEELTPAKIRKSGYESMFNPVQRLDINEAGPFCVWEDTIVGYERKAWIKYLDSNRTEKDKKRYFSSTINRWM